MERERPRTRSAFRVLGSCLFVADNYTQGFGKSAVIFFTWSSGQTAELDTEAAAAEHHSQWHFGVLTSAFLIMASAWRYASDFSGALHVKRVHPIEDSISFRNSSKYNLYVQCYKNQLIHIVFWWIHINLSVTVSACHFIQRRSEICSLMSMQASQQYKKTSATGLTGR